MKSIFEIFPTEYIAERALVRAWETARAHHPPIKNRTITTRVVRKKRTQMALLVLRPRSTWLQNRRKTSKNEQSRPKTLKNIPKWLKSAKSQKENKKFKVFPAAIELQGSATAAAAAAVAAAAAAAAVAAAVRPRL